MKSKILFYILILFSMQMAYTSCIGDQGNVLNTYDVGTITEENGVPIIINDNINLKLTGNGLTIPSPNIIERCMATYVIDWDNQTQKAYTTNIYTAKISIKERWEAVQCEDIANKPFIGSDSINSISQPYMTIVGDKTLLTFQTSANVGENASEQFVIAEVNKTQSTMTLDYIFYVGEAPTITTTQNKWQSYILPEIDKNYNINIRFKSITPPTFESERYIDQDDENKNYYVYKMIYKKINNK